MTYIGYPDLQEGNGEYRAEALSPSNGKISRDGSRPVRNRYADTLNAVQTTAGMFWARASLTFFLTHEGERYFSVWPSWGERFVINLTRGELATGPTEAIAALEEQLAEDVLTRGNPVQDVFTCLGVIGLIQRRQIVRLVPLLQALWRSKRSREHCSTQCSELRGAEQTSLEPLSALCLVLASLGSLVPGPACYSFTPRPPKMAQEIADRPERINRLSRELNSLQVLELIGCPDYIDRVRVHDDWGSQWDYYTQNPLEVTRILWEPGSEGARIRSLDRLPFTPEDVEQRLRRLLRSV